MNAFKSKAFTMQNAAAVEALYSASYAENFLECMENLPNDLQKNISKLREYDFLLHRVRLDYQILPFPSICWFLFHAL